MTGNRDKTVLITGCSTGIGYCAAKGLKDRGYRIFATARKAEDIQRLTEEGFESTRLDLDDAASIATALDEILKLTQGRLYALFNNGAYGQPGAVEDLDTDVLRAQFETNLFGWHELTKRVLPVMREQGAGRIIQNSSVLGLVAMKYRGAYNASKYALEGLSDTLRLELHGSGVFVSLIEPGPIATRFRANAFDKWRQNIDPDNGVHQAAYGAMAERLQKEGPAAPFTLPPEAVLKRVIHALESPRPRPRYYVTFPTYLFGTLKRLLPARTLDRILRKV
ncbi:MAG: SDR family oxidoreductase [Gammaproteobacteria bacterium]|nr:SDR family oxidoreductase [Gammaproteobacteria bacterium]